MCTWEQFCRFAREPERRKVGVDARVTVDDTAFEVEPDMAGEFVVLLWGLFDNELYAESAVSDSGLIIRCPDRFRCIGTERSSVAKSMSDPTASVHWPISWACPSLRWPVTMCG